VKTYLDVCFESLRKEGEELCGDVVRIASRTDKELLILSDGLGGGVKANILATLTSEIIATMLNNNIGMKDVIETVIDTLPICSVRKLAYATFTVIQVDHQSRVFNVANFDNPPVMHFRYGRLRPRESRTDCFAGKQVAISEGTLEVGDCLVALSGGVLHASTGDGMDFTWRWDEIGAYFEGVLRSHPKDAHEIVHAGIEMTNGRYRGKILDDATVLGAFLRKTKSLIVFTGPPLDPSKDDEYADRVLNFEGGRIVCGGTTSQIIQRRTGEQLQKLFMSESEDIPPAEYLSNVDLVTEGILTMVKALEYLKAYDHSRPPYYPNAAEALAKELMEADNITFLVGQTVNPYYQNPQLPKSISIRRNLVEQVAEVLRSKSKEVTIELC
jgi:hypothetical protein